jgi:Type IV secretion system pilin
MKHSLRVLAFALPALLMPGLAFAALCGATGGGSGLANPICTTSISQFLANMLKLVAQIAFPIIVLFMVYVGFLFISSQGNPEKLKEARNYFFWAVVGALLVLGAEALSLAIKATVDQL